MELIIDLAANKDRHQKLDDDSTTIELAIKYIAAQKNPETALFEDRDWDFVGNSAHLLPILKDNNLFRSLYHLYPYSQLWQGKGLTVNAIRKWRPLVSPVSFF